MTFNQFMSLSEASPFHWEIFGEYNDLRFEGYSEEDAMNLALEYGHKLELEALQYQKKEG